MNIHSLPFQFQQLFPIAACCALNCWGRSLRPLFRCCQLSQAFVLIKGIVGLHYLNSFGLIPVSLKEKGRKSLILRASEAIAQAAPTGVVQGRRKVGCYSQAPHDWFQVQEAMTALLMFLSALRRRGLACALLHPLPWFWSLYSLLKHFWLQNLLQAEHEGRKIKFL